MLGPGRYLLGAAMVVLLVGFAWAGAGRLRARFAPSLEGAPAHLATGVVALALLLWSAQLLGTLSLLSPVPYLLLVAAVGLGLRCGLRGGDDAPPANRRPPSPSVPTALALAVAAVAMLKFGVETKAKLGTGMTGFDTTWYHGPFAAGFFQGGDTWSLHFIAPQFLAWFYPANSELFHAGGMLAFSRDLLSPLLNLGWLAGCLLACWCIGLPYRVAPWSLSLGAVALSLPALADQAGEMRNDIVGIFFLLAAVAFVLNARAGRADVPLPAGAIAVAGLAAGLAAGTKLNFLLPVAVLVAGMALLAPAGRRWRASGLAGLAALAGGGYWYLRNLLHSGNPLPWVDGLGPVSLPAPDQALGGREAHSVLGYLTDGAVWSDWFLPGLREGLTAIWPVLLAAAAAGLLLALAAARPGSRGSSGTGTEDGEPRSGARDRRLAVAGLAGIAAALAWALAPTSASGPEGMPRGFESGLRYLAPALVLGLALLPAAPPLRAALASLAAAGSGLRPSLPPRRATGDGRGRTRDARAAAAALVVLLLATAAGYPVQRHYLDNRYADPSFTDAPGLNAAFAWARDLSASPIATTSTRQYPLYGTDLSNRVRFVGEARPHGGFVPPSACPAWRRLLDRGDYAYALTSRDRPEPAKPPYPATARWTEGPWAVPVLREPPAVLFELTANPDPTTCPS